MKQLCRLDASPEAWSETRRLHRANGKWRRFLVRNSPSGISPGHLTSLILSAIGVHLWNQNVEAMTRFSPTPLNVENVADCYFYHTMELPGRGVIEGRDWDLRGRVDEYLGNVDFAGKRVLEIGPASGFLTFEMEKRGADVVSVEVTDEHGWDFVPYPDERLEEVFGPRRIVMQQLKNSYWFSHAALQSKARVYYGDAYNLPAALGEFDIAVMGSSAAPLPRPAPDR